MNNVPFEMIIEDLNCGREIEFAYHGKKYSITNSEGYWNFAVTLTESLLKDFALSMIKQNL